MNSSSKRFCKCLGLLVVAVLASNAIAGNGPERASLCEITNNIETYEGKLVRFDASAVAALHEYDVALVEETCKKRAMLLRASSEFVEDSAFQSMLKQLYPGFPDNDGYTNAKVPISVVGKVLRVENRGLLMTYLELASIRLRR